MRRNAGVEGWTGGTDVPLMVKLKTVVTMLLLAPKGVVAVLIVRN